MTVSIIGGHFTENGIERNYPARAVLSINGNGLDEQHPDTIILFRDITVYNDGPPDLHTHPQRRTIEYARWWYTERNDGPTLRQVWTANKHRAHFFTITNELGGSDAEHIKDHIAYEANICKLAAGDGLKCAVGKLAGDSPNWPSNLWQQLYAPFIVDMWNTYGAIYARHVYGGNLVDGNGNPTHDAPGNPSRPFDEIAHLRTLNYRGGIVLAECGLDGGYGLADYGRFREQALGYAAALKPHADMVIGLCWWECGETDFGANYTNHLKQIEPFLDMSLPKWTAADVPPDPPTPPGGDYKSVVFVAAQEHTKEQYLTIAGMAFDEYGRTLTRSGDNALVMVGDGNAESCGVIFDPELPSQQAVIALFEAAGLNYQTRYLSGNPLDGLRLGHLFKYRYQRNSSFNHARDYDGDGVKDDPHEGEDFDVIGGQTNNTVMVLCVYDGTVERVVTVSQGSAYGNYVRVKHTRNGKPFYTRYCHLETIAVSLGQTLAMGADIGEVGTTGNSTGEHVHLNLEVPGFGAVPPAGMSPYCVVDVVNPAPYLPTPAEMDALPPVPTPPTGQTFDMARYLFGKRDGRALQLSSGETVQYQEAGGFVYCVKNSQWEQFRYDGSYIWRGKDTSPGPAPSYAERPGQLRYYWQKETGQNAARWCPRYMTVGQVWTGFGHFCQYFYKADCSQSSANTGNATNKATLIAHHTTKTWGNLTVHDVLEFKGVGDEHFWLILDWGMGGWSAEWGESHVTELFQPGQRTLVRETGCYG